MFSDSVSVTTVAGCLRTKGLKGRTQKAGLQCQHVNHMAKGYYLMQTNVKHMVKMSKDIHKMSYAIVNQYICSQK